MNTMPGLPDCLTEEQKARYEKIAAIARRAADRLPHPADKFAEPAHEFRLHRNNEPPAD
jgi:hypothetical protein